MVATLSCMVATQYEAPAVSNGCSAWRALGVAETVTHVP